MAVESERSEVLRPYGNVEKFLPRTYATDAFTTDEYSDVATFYKCSAMTAETYSQVLWHKALPSGTAFSERRLKSLFIDGLLTELRKKTCQFHFLSLRSDSHSVARQSQALDKSALVARRPARTAPAVENNEETGFRRGAKTLSIEFSSAKGPSIRGEDAGSEERALVNFYTLPRNRATRSRYHRLPRRKRDLETR